MPAPDKSWLPFGRASMEYRNGLTSFTEYAKSNTKGEFPEGKLPCPCSECNNRRIIAIPTMRKHCIINGWDEDYMIWSTHGELYSVSTMNVIRPPSPFTSSGLERAILYREIMDSFNEFKRNHPDEQKVIDSTEYSTNDEIEYMPSLSNSTSCQFTGRVEPLKGERSNLGVVDQSEDPTDEKIEEAPCLNNSTSC